MSVREDLKAYHDLELDEARRTEVREALERDESLRIELEEVALLSNILRTQTAPIPTHGLERTLEALTVRRRRMQLMPRRLGYAALAGVALLTAFALLPELPGGGMDEANAAKRESKLSWQDTAASTPASAAPMEQAPMDGAVGGARGFAGPGSVEAVNGAFIDKMKSRETRNRSQAGEEMPARAKAEAGHSAAAMPTLVVKNGTLAVSVASVGDAVNQAESIVRGAGGFVESANRGGFEGGLASANLVARVPVVRFENVFASFRKLGKVQSESASGEDVTAQVVDTEARLKVMRAEEEAYRTLMGRATKIGEILEVRERLAQVRQEIESLDAQRNSLRGQARMSTINLSLNETPKPVKVVKPVVRSWSQNAWDRAIVRLAALGQAFGTIAITLAVFAPLWLPLLFLGWLAYRRRYL